MHLVHPDTCSEALTAHVPAAANALFQTREDEDGSVGRRRCEVAGEGEVPPVRPAIDERPGVDAEPRRPEHGNAWRNTVVRERIR